MNENVDLFFAKAIYPQEDEDIHAFLAHLFAEARKGHLCTDIQASSESIRRGAEKMPPCKEIKEENGLWYLERNWMCEKLLTKDLRRIAFQPPFSHEASDDLSLTSDQKKALQKALKAPLTLISGGPGTGKSRTACALISSFLENPSLKIALVAPTGKATSHLRHLLPPHERLQIMTLQALLKDKMTLSYDVVVVDESSMVDAFLMQRLFSQLKKKVQIILLGDVHQLPPVGVGNLFRDIAEAFPECTTHFTECLRTDLKEIIGLARCVLEKELFPIFELPPQISLIQELKKRLLSPTATLPWLFQKYRSFRLLSPQRRGPYGVDTLNALFFSQDQSPFYPIIITSNDGSLCTYNGDFALVDREKELVHSEQGLSIPLSMIFSYEYGYLLSVHKSQGSEFDEVMVLLPEGAEHFGKEMLYTAVTRAKQKVTVWGEKGIVEKIYTNNSLRKSGLKKS